MISLIKNELIKIFKKKSIIVVLFVLLAFVVLFNVMYKLNNSNENTRISANYVEELKTEVASLEKSGETNSEYFVSRITELQTEKLKQEYKSDDWQQEIISQYIYSTIYNINEYKYNITKDKEIYEKAKVNYDEYIKALNSGDWKIFAKTEKSEIEKTIKDYDEVLKIADKQEKENIKQQYEIAKINLECINLRLEKEIIYGNNYRNNALESYRSVKQDKIRGIEQSNNNIKNSGMNGNISMSEQEKKINEQAVNENIAINKYIIDTGEDVKKQDDLRGGLVNLYSNFELFVIVAIVIIAASIVSDEFNKGTIKLLLVRPHTRVKILLAKLITILIMLVLIMLILVGMELIVGGITFGFDSLSTEVVQYNHNSGNLEVMSVFKYLLIISIAKLPFFILIAMIGFFVGSILNNGAIGITIALLGYMSSDLINALSQVYNLIFMKFFITPNWHLEQYLFGKLPEIPFVNFSFSALMCIVYFLIMVVPTFIIFKKRNIKNI